MTGKRQGIARLVIGTVAASWTAITFYFVGAVSIGLVYVAAFALAWFGARLWLKSGRWRSPLGYAALAVTVGLATVLSNIIVSTTSDESSTRVMGAIASLLAGLMLSVWFSPHRWERIE